MTALLLLIAAIPHSPVAEDRCDVVEINHYHDGEGKLMFVQSIWWRWQGERHEVQAWRLVKSPSQAPLRSRHGWTVLWFDGERLRRIDADSYRETWTQYDPEMADRAETPSNQRLGLAGEAVQLPDAVPAIEVEVGP